MKLNDLFFFVQVVDKKGFAAASRALQIPKSSLSKRVAALEHDLGIRLIERSTRRFAVTEAGEDFYRHAAAALLEAEAAREAARSRLAEPRGLVRITASMTTVQAALGDLLPELARHYPKIQIALTATNRFVDLIEEGFDLAVRAHFAPLPASDYVQRRLGFAPNHLVAAPDHIARQGRPECPEDIADHDGVLPTHFPETSRWTLRGKNGEIRQVRPKPRFYADDPVTSLNAAIAGLGIASLPHGLCAPALAAGKLEQLLPDWDSGGATFTLLMSHRRGQSPSLRAVADFLADGLTMRLGLS